MKLEDQVTSFELSKRLDELGVKKDSYFYWNEGQDFNDEGDLVDRIELLDREITDTNWISFKAYTFTELAEMLPSNIVKDEFTYFLQALKVIPSCWIFDYVLLRPEINEKDSLTLTTSFPRNVADQLANLLIYLIENNLVKVGDINVKNVKND